MRVTPPPPPEPAAHEKQLAWLEWVVGGAQELAALDVVPLLAGPQDVDPPLGQSLGDGLDGRLLGDRHLRARRLRSIVDLVREVGPAHLGSEGTLSASRIAVRAVAARPSLLTAMTNEATAAAALIAAGRGNGLVGQGRATSAKAIGEACGLPSAPSQRARSFADAVAGATLTWPVGMGYTRGPDVFLLRSPDLLVSEFRRELIRVRTTALTLRESAAQQPPRQLIPRGQAVRMAWMAAGVTGSRMSSQSWRVCTNFLT